MTTTIIKTRCTNCGSRLPIDGFGTWVDVYCRSCKRVVRLIKDVIG